MCIREAWITGVMQHYPGEPKPSYISPWDETPEWERESAAAVYDQVRVHRRYQRQYREAHPFQKGRFVALLDRANL
jgi:hypothetical protein